MSKEKIVISDAEWQVMKVLWKKSPLGLQEIISALISFKWTSTTIQTYLSRLVKKGILTTERYGKGYLYSPTITEETCRFSESTKFIQRVYDGSFSHMVLGFVKSGNISQNDIDLLKEIISEEEKKNENNK